MKKKRKTIYAKQYALPSRKASRFVRTRFFMPSATKNNRASVAEKIPAATIPKPEGRKNGITSMPRNRGKADNALEYGRIYKNTAASTYAAPHHKEPLRVNCARAAKKTSALHANLKR